MAAKGDASMCRRARYCRHTYCWRRRQRRATPPSSTMLLMFAIIIASKGETKADLMSTAAFTLSGQQRLDNGATVNIDQVASIDCQSDNTIVQEEQVIFVFNSQNFTDRNSLIEKLISDDGARQRQVLECFILRRNDKGRVFKSYAFVYIDKSDQVKTQWGDILATSGPGGIECYVRLVDATSDIAAKTVNISWLHNGTPLESSVPGASPEQSYHPANGDNDNAGPPLISSRLSLSNNSSLPVGFYGCLAQSDPSSLGNIYKEVWFDAGSAALIRHSEGIEAQIGSTYEDPFVILEGNKLRLQCLDAKGQSGMRTFLFL